MNKTLDPSRSKAKLLRGQLLRAAGQHARALEPLEEAVRENPGLAWELDLISCIPRRHGYPIAVREVKALERLAESRPDSQVVWACLGLAWRRQGRFREAINAFTRASSLDPRSHWPFALRALAWEGLEDFQMALADMSRACARWPGDARVRCHRAVYWLRCGRPDKALDDLDAAVRARPAAWTLAWRGEVLLWLGLDLKAWSDLDAALRLRDESRTRLTQAWTWTWKAGAEIRLGLLGKAGESLAEALRFDPLDDEAMTRKAELLFLQGRHQEGLGWCRRAESLNDSRLGTHLVKGALSAAAGEPKRLAEAVRSWRKWGGNLLRYVYSCDSGRGRSDWERRFSHALALCRGDRSWRPVFFPGKGLVPRLCR